MTTALILAGHGSHISPHTAGLIWSYVDQLRAWGVADEITAGFWKEQPSLWQVVDTVSADDVVIVPVFTAQGYFTRQVIPAEMRLTERNIHYARTLGEHPYVTQIITEIVQSTIQERGLSPDETAIALIGHGTKRNPDSRTATREKSDYLRQQHIAAESVDVYLDDIPDIPSIYTITSAKNIVAVPFFLAPGSHVTIDVPEALGIQTNPQHINGRIVHYAEPFGTNEVIAELILALANETGIRFERKQTTSPWQSFPRVGAQRLVDAVQTSQELAIGELTLTPTCVKPRHNPGDKEINSSAELRALVRENPFRSLATSKGLSDGWHVPLTSIEDLPNVVETIYPGAIAAYQIPCDTLQSVSQRQQGMFKNIDKLDETTIQSIIRKVCGNCVLHPAWHGASGEIPCVTPCNHWLSAAKEDQ